MRVLLFANGVVTEGKMLRRALDDAHTARIVCADGGALHARRFGLTPDIIIGDLDSLTAAETAEFASGGVQIQPYPTQKNETDLELALAHCVDIGARSVSVIGAFGGRIDQTLANIQLLALPSLRDTRLLLVDGDQSLRLLRPGAHEILGALGDTISLLPLTDEAVGISSAGLRYPLRDDTLPLGPARGISNVMTEAKAQVTLRHGRLLLAHTVGRA